RARPPGADGELRARPSGVQTGRAAQMDGGRRSRRRGMRGDITRAARTAPERRHGIRTQGELTGGQMAADTRSVLESLLEHRILVLDGAMGTMIQRHTLTEAEFRGERFRDHGHDLRGDNEVLVLTRPDVITGIHEAYLDAGADIIETNSFSSTAIA